MEIKIRNLAFCIFLLVLLSFAFADEVQASDIFEQSFQAVKANSCIRESQHVIELMAFEELSVQGQLDSLKIAKNFYEQGIELEKQGNTADYSLVFKKCSEISLVAESAFDALDRLEILKSVIEDSGSKEEMKEAWAIYNNAESEINDGRYDLALKLIEEGNAKALELGSLQTRASAIYDSASSNLMKFIQENQAILSALVVLIIVFLILFNKQARIFLLTRQMNDLEREKEVVKDLIKEAQDQYFNKRKLAENVYMTRVKLYEGLARDINRKLSVLREHIEKNKRRKSIIQKVFDYGRKKRE